MDAPSINSPLSATVFRIVVQRGEVIKSAEQLIVELEAMKTSVKVTAGEEFVGMRVLKIVAEVGDDVSPGSALVYVE